MKKSFKIYPDCRLGSTGKVGDIVIWYRLAVYGMQDLPKGWLAEVFKEAAEAVKKIPKEEREYYEQHSS